MRQLLVIQILHMNLICPRCGNKHRLSTSEGNDYCFTVCHECGVTFRTDWEITLKSTSTELIVDKSRIPFRIESDLQSIGSVEYDEDEEDDETTWSTPPAPVGTPPSLKKKH
jgi:uncharacterized Zn finger protein